MMKKSRRYVYGGCIDVWGCTDIWGHIDVQEDIQMYGAYRCMVVVWTSPKT